MRTTVGSILINNMLPEDLRDYDRVWDKKSTSQVLDQLARRYPEKYSDISDELHKMGFLGSYLTSHSVGLDDLANATADEKTRTDTYKFLSDLKYTDMKKEDRENAIAEYLNNISVKKQKHTLETLAAQNNPLAQEVLAGARGNAAQLNSMVGSPVLILDEKDRPAPVPIFNSFSQGLSPAEYFAKTYGTRKGAVSTKFATADAGFLSKQIALSAHKIIASGDKPTPGIGLPVDADDTDNIGSVLAMDVGKYKAGTIITPEVMANFPEDTKKILVHSAISDYATDGGVPSISFGLRERDEFPLEGEQVGIPAIQTITERLSQGVLNVKHTGGAGGKRAGFGGFKVIDQLLQVPKVFPSGAAHASLDGEIQRIEDAPGGGRNIFINDTPHYVADDQDPKVKVGEIVEAGDVLSDGLPNPAFIVEHKGIGEGRKYFMELMRDVLGNSAVNTNRKNIEVLSRAIINHVEVTEENSSIPGALPGDTIEYDYLASNWNPRKGSVTVPTKNVKSGYLEKPVLHYSIGTRITPRVRQTLKDFKVPEVTINDDPPPFQPVQKRAMTQLLYTPDWMERLGSFYIGKGLLDSVHRGGTADMGSKSYIPRLVTGQPVDVLERPKGLLD